MNKKILLVYCGKKATLPRLPLSCLVLASYLRKYGYESDVLDLRVDDYSNLDLENYSFVGLSVMTEAIPYAIDFSRFVKEKNKNVKIVWGGSHVTFFPESINNKYIDYIITKEGEEKLLSLITGNPFKEDFIDMDKLELPAYDKVDLNKYADLRDGFSYETSRGCPNKCSFCYVSVFHKRKWRAKSPKKVVMELKEIIKKYKIKKFRFLDDNFFVDKKRSLEICKRLINLDIEWDTTARADYISEYTDDEMRLIKNSGCKYLIFGGESGSKRILSEIVKKDVLPEQLIESAEKCLRSGIGFQTCFMMGLPTETKKDMLMSLDLYDKLKRLGNGVRISGISLYMPVPNTELYDLAVEMGYKKQNTSIEFFNRFLRKNSDEEWFNNQKNVTWIEKKLREEIFTICAIARFNFYLDYLYKFSKEYQIKKLNLNKIEKIIFPIIIRLYKIDADFRWKRKFFKFGIEWRLFIYLRNKKTEIK